MRGLLLLVLPASLGLGFLSALSCEGEADGGPGEPGPEGVVIRIGGAEFTLGELEAQVPFVRGFDPSQSPKSIRRYALTDLLLPRLVARRLCDPAQLGAVRDRADRLASVVADAGGGLAELRAFGEKLGGSETEPLRPWNDLPLDVAERAFSLPPGRASGALHGIRGSYVLAPLEEAPRGGEAGCTRRFYLVFFPYSTDPGFEEGLRKGVRAILETTPEIHPRFREDFAPSFPRSLPLLERAR